MKTDRNEMRKKMQAKMKAAAEKSGQGGASTLNLPKGVKRFEVKENKNVLDIVPYEVTSKRHPQAAVGDLWPERTFFVHFNVGPEKKSVVCPRSVRKPCPICEERDRLMRDPDGDEEAEKELRAKKRQAFNIMVDGGIQVLETAHYNFGAKLDEEIASGEIPGDYFWPEGGKTILVRFKKESAGGGRSYLEAGRVDAKDREDIPAKVLAAAVDLDAALIILPYEEIEEMFKGTDDDEDDDEEKAPAKGKGKLVDEDGDGDKEDEDEDEDEEDKKPAAKSSKGKKASKEDEEEDSDDDDEDDDDEESDDKDEESDDDDEDEDKDEESDDEDDDDEDESEDDDDEEEDEKPAKGKGKKAAVKDDEDEDEDEDESDDEEDDDDEEDEKPAKGKAKKVKCPACSGTGKNSKGRPCLACGGEGKIDDDE